jgi:hypothetical protein
MTCEKRCGLQAGETRPFFALKKRPKAERRQRWSHYRGSFEAIASGDPHLGITSLEWEGIPFMMCAAFYC